MLSRCEQFAVNLAVPANSAANYNSGKCLWIYQFVRVPFQYRLLCSDFYSKKLGQTDRQTDK